ncbi:MAG: hypothetical protein FJ240_07030 [Nitrospira sp.]|nr:hypothetical protein [Nitrospira sp.]
MKDLFVLVADKNMEFALQGILQRTESLCIKNISFDIKSHIGHDSGVYKSAHDFLRLFLGKYSYALVMFDREGCGCVDASWQLAGHVQNNLDRSGWQGKSKVIVIDPELEIWIWSNSPHVAACLGWENSELRDWLRSKGYLQPSEDKPQHSKDAFIDALRNKGKQKSSSLFSKIAERVSFEHCTDSAFRDLKITLQTWFPIEE